MNNILITTTTERLAAVRHELETAYMGGERGWLLSAFLDDCARAHRLEQSAVSVTTVDPQVSRALRTEDL